MQSNASSKTLLSHLEPFQKPGDFPRDVVHPFATGAPESCNRLQDFVNAVEQISASLRLYDASAQWTNPKLISQLRQHAAIENTSLTAERGVQHLAETLKARVGVGYGENIPVLASSVPDWCIEQLLSWGRSLEMETWKESREGSLTVILGGKLLVIDIDLLVQSAVSSQPKLAVINVKTSIALVTGNSNASISTHLDSFLYEGIKEYCAEMQKDEDSRDSQRAAASRRRIIEHLRYLVLLDGLAMRKDNGGVRWFKDIDDICPTLNELAKAEAQACAISLSLQKAPLDVFLLRSHSLPLPYLTVPSMSFLIHVSPSAYLSLLYNTSRKPTAAADGNFLDISVSELRNALKTVSIGVTIATLYLQQLPGAHLYPGSMSMPNVISRPTFLLCPSASNYDHTFPQIDASFSMALGHSTEAPYAWILDFTENGKRRGIVMSQSRMKAVELVVNPIGVGNEFNTIDTTPHATWVDLLLNPNSSISSARYTTLYTSPNSVHPPLQLRLAAPEEAGYILEKIPVHSMKELWGILEIVREQCWLNETLLICDWMAEGSIRDADDMPDTVQANEQDLQAVLSGTFTPRKIPVNVLLPSGNQTDDLFGPTELDFLHGTRPKIVMSCPERAPISGLIEITVSYDEKKPRGVSVNIQGTVGLDVNASKLEEVCRRGGTWGLPGRIWASGHGFS